MSHKLLSLAMIQSLSYFHRLSSCLFFALGLFFLLLLLLILFFIYGYYLPFSLKMWLGCIAYINFSLSLAEWEERSCGICLVNLGQPMHWSERLRAEGRNGSRICALLKQALMPPVFIVWIYSELLTECLIHYFYCTGTRAGMLLNLDIPQMSDNENPHQVVQPEWDVVSWKV